MSYLKQVLSTQSEIEISSARKHLQEISKEINIIKDEVFTYLQKQYVEFEPISNNDHVLTFKCEVLSTNIENISNQINSIIKPEIEGAEKEIIEIKDQIKESDYELRLSSEILEMHKNLRAGEEQLERCKFKESIESLTALEYAVANPKENIEALDVFEEFSNRALMLRYSLISSIEEIYRSNLELIPASGDSYAGGIKIDISHFDDFQEAFVVLNTMKRTSTLISECGYFLETSIFEPIMKHQCTIEMLDKSPKVDIVRLNVSIKNKKKPHYRDVLDRLKKVIEFIENFLDIAFDENTSVLKLLGTQFGGQFANILIDNCLNELIPTCEEDMNDFPVIAEDIRTFTDDLIKRNFLHPGDEGSNIIFDFLDSIPQKYGKHIYDATLKYSQDIMRKDLHSMIEVELNEISQSPFKKCQVSKSCIEFMNYMFKTMNLAIENTGKSAFLITTAVRDSINLYYIEVPQYHQKLLDTIPQQVAIFYNNCMYIARKVEVLEAQFHKKIKEILNDKIFNFEDLSNKLKKTAEELFKNQLKTQKEQILTIIKDSGLSQLGIVAHLDSNTEKSIRQCLRQLELLQTVWKNVLPQHVYDKSLGYLLNSMVGDLIQRVIDVEDLSADSSKQLVNFYTLIKQRGPKVFTDPNEIHRHVSLWSKLNEIIFLLEASLHAIEDRWSDGKGPLAVVLQPEELKKIIRSLFQNTDNRASLLNKIK